MKTSLLANPAPEPYASPDVRTSTVQQSEKRVSTSPPIITEPSPTIHVEIKPETPKPSRPIQKHDSSTELRIHDTNRTRPKHSPYSAFMLRSTTKIQALCRGVLARRQFKRISYVKAVQLLCPQQHLTNFQI
mgnify:CR=1 FL=1